MSTRALNDEEVFSEMKKMIAFIKQEALEKARELKVKADEEFNIEKAKIVRQETIHIETAYQKRIKQSEVQKQIAQSNFVNQCRLKVLKKRQELLDDLFEKTRSELMLISKDSQKYQELLKRLILQGLFQLMEDEIVIRCRKSDLDLVRDCVEPSIESYKKATGQDLFLQIDEEKFLPEGCAGGVQMSALGNRISIDNTLQRRLELLSEQMLPDIRMLLFGPSPSRKFFN